MPMQMKRTAAETKNIKLHIDTNIIAVAVPTSVFVHFSEQFARANPTPIQKKKYKTVLGLMKAAYLQGKSDATPKIKGSSTHPSSANVVSLSGKKSVLEP